LGNKNQIPSEVRSWFSQTGISHILAVSGLHISIFSQLITIFFINVLLISRQKVFWPTFLVVVFFVILVGAPASAVRAAIMGLSLSWSQKIARPQTSKRLIIYAATLMLLVNPQLLKSDIGFQLSFLAVIGMIFLSETFNGYFNKIPNFQHFPLRRCLASTISAQIFVLPLVLYYFGNLSLVSPLINVLVISIMPLIMIFGLMFALIGLIGFCLAKIFFYPIWFLSTLVILAAKLGALAPGSYLTQNFPLYLTIVLYILIIFWLVKSKKMKYNQ
jgi:competence protein ComEC